jgi:hypothetical protein
VPAICAPLPIERQCCRPLGQLRFALIDDMNPAFRRYIGIDYSGAQTPISSLRGLRVYEASHVDAPREIQPPPSPRKYWTRRGVAEWLTSRLSEGTPILIGIDHAFSFPLQYFERHALPLDWPLFLDDFQRHWPTDGGNTYVEFVRDGSCGNGAARSGNTHWRRITELRTRTAKSVFQFDVQGQVAKSTHPGLPWLRYIRRQLGDAVHFWPFDGWSIPPNSSVVVEVYPALWNRAFPCGDRTSDQHDAYATAEWLRRADASGTLVKFLCPEMKPSERKTAEVEGWILGVV